MRRRGARAFTLIEVLAALLIFGVALVGFMENLGTTNRVQADLATRARAGMLAQNIREELRTKEDFEVGTKDGDFEGENSAYHWKRDIEKDEKIDGLDRVTVLVGWNDGRDRTY